jgi:hypothetical protein
MLVVATFVGVAGWNRSGEPRLAMMLTERELQLPHAPRAPGDDPGLRLRIVYEGRYDPLDARNWLPEPKLREIGFPLDVPVGAPQAADVYDRVPPRVAWVVFEFDGPQWREIERRRALRPPDRFPPPAQQSRLVPVDAGLDFDTLRIRYPSGHLILRGVIGMAYLAPKDGGPLVYGTLRDVVPGGVAVPSQLRHVVDGLMAPPPGAPTLPRYEVELAVGSLGFPYVRALRLVGRN